MNPTSKQWNVENYQKFADFVPLFGQPLLEMLQAKPGERILDLGCGDGALTEKLLQAGCTVVGMDTSPELLTAATARGIDARRMDARTLTFTNEFDAVFSNAVLHWVKEPHLAIKGVAKALKPGGRFVAEFGGKGNVATIERALIEAVTRHGQNGDALNPWYFPAAETYQALLEQNGFTVEFCALIPRPTPLPQGMTGWLKTFADSYLKPFPSVMQAQILNEVTAELTNSLCDKNGNWHADYVRLRVAATKKH